VGPARATETVRISNGGLGRLTELEASVRYDSGGKRRVARGESVGGRHAGDAHSSTPDVDALPAGVYEATVVVTSGESDDLSAELRVRLSLAGITVRETGAARPSKSRDPATTFSVVLDLDPGADVHLSVTAENPEWIDVSPTRLSFTTSNWSTPQTVTVSAVDDRIVQGDRTTEILVSVDDAEETPYERVDDRAIRVTVVDDDVAGFLVSETGGWTGAREGGFTDTLFVVLTAEPLTDVVFSAYTDDPSDAILEPAELRFRPHTWDEPQILIFTAVEDNRRDGFGFRTLTIAVDPERSDPAFHGLSRTIEAITFDGDRFGESPPGPGG
jgi:hypothetical protein